MNCKRFKDCFVDGEVGEKKLKTILEKIPEIKSIEKTTADQDMHDHIDFIVKFKNGTVITLDHKSPKKWNRSSKEYLDDKMVIEIKNVQGKKGWLYGKADRITQDYPHSNEIIMYHRAKLKIIVDELIKNGNIVDKKVRNGREDLIILVERKDLVRAITAVFSYI